VSVTHVANRSLESSQKAAKECNIPNTCNSWQELIASPDIDAVCIGTWPYTHAEMTIAALEAGKHVLCEARMAMNAGEARAMAACAKAHPNLVAQIVPSPLTLKFDKTVAQIIKSGEIGSVVALVSRRKGCDRVLLQGKPNEIQLNPTKSKTMLSVARLGLNFVGFGLRPVAAACSQASQLVRVISNLDFD